MPNSLISKITIGSTTYDIKDAQARSDIEALQQYTDYLGVTTTALTDGATTNPITIGGESVTAVKGNIVNYGSKEFIWNGSEWQEFGDLSAITNLLGDLAYEDTAEGSYTPAGSVSAQTFSGEELTSTGSYTPAGSVSAQTFSGEELTSTGSYTPAGTVSKPDVDVSATYDNATETLTISAALHETPSFSGTAATLSVAGTPAGSVSQATFSGTAATISVAGTPAGSVSQATFSGTAATITVAAPVTP